MAITVIDLGTNTGDNATTVTIAVPAGGIPAGSLICVGTTSDASIGSCFDSVSNTYTTVSLIGSEIVFFYCWNSKALTSANHISISTSNQTAVTAFYATGVRVTSNPYDTAFAAIGNATGTTNPSITSTNSPAVANSLAVGFIGGLLNNATSSNSISAFPSGYAAPFDNAQVFDFGAGGGAWAAGATKTSVSTSQTFNPNTSQNIAIGTAKIAIFAFAPAGVVYADGVQEAGAAADTESATQVANVSVAETMSAADSPDAVAIINMVETLTADDSEDAETIPEGVLNDTLNAEDSTDLAPSIYNPTVSDSMSAADIPDGFIIGQPVDEVITITDTTDALQILVAEVDEVSLIIDNLPSFQVYFDEVNEASDLVDNPDAHFEIFMEAANLQDTTDTATSYQLSVVEVVVATDYTDVPVIDVVVIDEIALIDSIPTPTVDYVPFISEQANVLDTSGIDIAADIDQTNLVDDPNATGVYVGIVSDVLTAAESQNALVDGNQIVTEDMTITDVTDAVSSTLQDNEVLTALDTTDAVVVINVEVDETMDLSDGIGQTDLQVSDVLSIIDVYNAIFQVNQPAEDAPPPVMLRSIHDVLTDRAMRSDPTDILDLWRPPIRIPPISPRLRRRKSIQVVEPEDIRLRSVHDVLTTRAKNSDPTDQEG